MGIKKMKKICFCISDITLCGGTESVCLSLANALCNHSYEVHILSISNQNKETFSRVIKKYICPRCLEIWR